MENVSIQQHKAHFPLLDGLRVCAALLVVGEHLRSALFSPFSTLSGSEKFAAPFYAATSLGHEAVVIFFALSGYLVGGGVLSQFAASRWSARKYILRRMTRLWIVLIPALVFTAVLDSIIVSVFGRGILDGTMEAVASLPTREAPASYALGTFLANMFFLQTIVAPVYGSNGPLWSLAYEFWYYALFPLVVFALLGSGWIYRCLSAGTALAIGFLLPPDILKLGIIWLVGAICATRLGERFPFTNSPRWSPIVALGFIAVLLVASVMKMLPGGDVLLGVMIAGCLPYLCQAQAISHVWEKRSAFGAEISYSIYLFHFPMVVAFGAIFGFENRYAPSVFSLGIFVCVAVAIICFCILLWSLFERHTNIIYQYLYKRLLQSWGPSR